MDSCDSAGAPCASVASVEYAIADKDELDVKKGKKKGKKIPEQHSRTT